MPIRNQNFTKLQKFSKVTEAKERLLSEAAKLGNALRTSNVFQDFAAAQHAADISARVRQARQQLFEARAKVQEAMQNLGDVASAVKHFNSTQAELQSLPEIKKLFASQQELLSLFEFIAAQISEASGVDFVDACRVSGGCCG